MQLPQNMPAAPAVTNAIRTADPPDPHQDTAGNPSTYPMRDGPFTRISPGRPANSHVHASYLVKPSSGGVPVNDAVVLSDLHLGSSNCQAVELVEFLETIRRGELPTRQLILNGDVFDSIDFRRLNKHHWRVLSLLRKMADTLDIVWINGNHDGSAEIVSHLLGVKVREELVVESGDKRVLFLHGHRFDEFIESYPIATRVADYVYRFLQRIDSSHTFAKMAKKNSKVFLRCAAKIEQRSREYAAKLGCDAVCCGHTHHAVAVTGGRVEYFNSGCWTEKPCHFLTLRNGVVAVHEYVPVAAETVPDFPQPEMVAVA
jgi:UDP-2,3-diacylglucosamine pyrophosphatase LpxH